MASVIAKNERFRETKMSMPRFYLSSVRLVTAIVFLYASVGQAQAQTAVPAARQARSVQVTINGVPITEKDLGRLVRGLYEAATKKVDTIKKKPTEMLAQSPYVYYAGRDAVTGRGLVWESNIAPPETEAKAMNDEYTAAYALAAVDLGFVGEPWKTLYHNAVKDDASRLAFGQEISRAFVEASDLKQHAAETDVAWVRKNMTIGMSRKKVYSALRSYGLIAYNYEYAPGTPRNLGNLTGCTFDDEPDRLAAAWPYPGKPLPKRTGGCAIMRTSKPEPLPTANITLEGGFSIACGSRIGLTMTFGPGDLLKKLDISKPEWACV